MEINDDVQELHVPQTVWGIAGVPFSLDGGITWYHVHDTCWQPHIIKRIYLERLQLMKDKRKKKMHQNNTTSS